jgi:hypothetical protein
MDVLSSYQKGWWLPLAEENAADFRSRKSSVGVPSTFPPDGLGFHVPEGFISYRAGRSGAAPLADW